MLLTWIKVANPSSQNRTFPSVAPMPLAAAPYWESGLVQWHQSEVSIPPLLGKQTAMLSMSIPGSEPKRDYIDITENSPL
jgi:hypothetical protein